VSSGTDFLDALRQLERDQPNRPRIGEGVSREQDIVALGQEPHVDFSDTNLSAPAETADGKPLIRSRFLGLLGPQGALPLHTTYEARHWMDMRDPSFSRFADVFNNRFLQMFYRAWANSRPAVQADRPNDNQFKAYIGSVIGIATPSTQNRDSLNDISKLALAGIMSPAVKSASRLQNVLSWLFKLDVQVDQFVGVWLALDREEQATLSKGGCSLGTDSLVGKSAYSLHDRFTVRISARDLTEFESFLPRGERFKLLADAVTFYTGTTYIYDVLIGLPEKETRPVQLGGFGRLGWTSWLTKPSTQNEMRWDCRFHPAEIS
jgi:type VI secretion system protein ImpH